jgi:glycosyltransferase involved in cell wall biosynthesis
MPHAVIYYGGFSGRSFGAFMHARTLRSALLGMGWRVSVISLDSLPILVRHLPHLVEKVVNAFFPPMGFHYKGRVTALLYRLLRTPAADLHVFEDIYLSWNSTTPAVTIVHAVWSDNLQAFDVASAHGRRLIASESNTIGRIGHPLATVSEPYREYLVHRHFAAAPLRKRLDVVELGLDLADFRHGEAPRRRNSLIYCGTLEARKNVLFLLQVFRKVAAADPSATLTVLGDGPERSVLERFVSQHALPVTFGGRVAHEEVLRALQAHSIYVHTSVKESFSFALLEAKLCGLWTCALSSLEVPRSFIDLGFESFDAADWANAILRLEGAPSLAGFPDYSAERMARRTLTLAGVSHLGTTQRRPSNDATPSRCWTNTEG